jgi:transposase
VIGSLHNRHRAIEFHKFLQKIDREVPEHLDVHLVLDNSSTHKSPKIRRWLAQHPRFVLHLPPTSSSWINLVERWFGELTTKKLKRSAHTSVRQLSAEIRVWIEDRDLEREPTSLRVEQARRTDPRLARPLLPTNQPNGTLAVSVVASGPIRRHSTLPVVHDRPSASHLSFSSHSGVASDKLPTDVIHHRAKAR